VRRLILVLTALGVVGLVVYRQRTIDRWERTLRLNDSSGGPGSG
jgi:hypothetical protein